MSRIKYVQTPCFEIAKATLKKPQPNMHYHHAYELYYILEGEREYFVEDTFFKIKKGDLIWVPANMLHRTDGKGATRILTFVKPEFLNKYIRWNSAIRIWLFLTLQMPLQAFMILSVL